MVRIRPSAARGTFDHGWLDTRHTFSFAGYHDRDHMGFRALRVINEDRVQPGTGFGMHDHHDMEILTYVISGTLAHRDSLGHVEHLHSGELQRMSAGTGIEHSEFNASDREWVHLYQIWLRPERRGLPPSYEQRAFPATEPGLHLVAAPDGVENTLRIHQDARVYLGRLDGQTSCEHTLGEGRHAWVQVVDGTINLNEHSLASGDGAAVSEESRLSFRANGPASWILFELA